MNGYRTVREGFEDGLMREAVQNISNINTPYSLLGFGCVTGKYNCQDWAQDLRMEYYRLYNQRNFAIWQNTINSTNNY